MIYEYAIGMDPKKAADVEGLKNVTGGVIAAGMFWADDFRNANIIAAARVPAALLPHLADVEVSVRPFCHLDGDTARARTK